MGDHVRGSTPGAVKSMSVYNQSPRSTQPGHPSMGRDNEYQPNGSDAVQLGSKGQVWFVSGCVIPLLSWPYLSISSNGFIP